MRGFSLLMLAALLLGGSDAVRAAGHPKGKTTNHRAEMDESYNKRLNPGYEIPVDPDKSRWRVTGKIGDKVIYPTSVPLYSFDGEARGTRLTELPIGAQVKMEKVRAYKGRHYYGVETEQKLGNGQVVKKTLWVDGFQLERQ